MSIGLNNPVIRGSSIPFRFFAAMVVDLWGSASDPVRGTRVLLSGARKATERLR